MILRPKLSSIKSTKWQRREKSFGLRDLEIVEWGRKRGRFDKRILVVVVVVDGEVKVEDVDARVGFVILDKETKKRCMS